MIRREPHVRANELAFHGMFLHKFAARASDQVAALERALAAGNAAELARQAQAIKRLAAHLPADALAKQADELECTAGRGDLAGAGAAVARTREEIVRSVEAVLELLSQLAAADDDRPQDPSHCE